MIPHLFSALLIAQYWQGDFLLPSPRFHPIGVVATTNVASNPGEKHRALQVSYKVVTQGGECHWFGDILDSKKRRLLPVADGGFLPVGEGLIVIEVPGGAIEAFAADGPLTLANIQVICGPRYSSDGFMDPRRYETPPIRAADFQHVIPDFEMKPSQPRFSAHAGEAASIYIPYSSLGSWNLPVDMHLADLPAGIIPNTLSGSRVLSPRIARNAVPGIYPVRAVGKAGTVEHSVTFELEILPPRDQLFPPDGSEPAAPAPIAPKEPAIVTALDVGAHFRAEVDLRPMNVVLVVQHGSSLDGPRCEAMKQLAAYFVQQFVEGRDNVGVVGFSDGVHILDPIREDFKSGRASTLSRIATLRCEGSGGVHAYALEVAYQQIKARNDPAALNLIVMLTAAPPSKIAAEWPVRTKADRRYTLEKTGDDFRTPPKEVDLPASTCSDTHNWRASFAPTRPTLLWKPEADSPALLSIGSDCALSKATPSSAINAFRQDIAYIPETDLMGIPFSGALELERFSSGPYSGRIRNDSFHNLSSAAINNFINAAQAARADALLKPIVDIIAIGGIDSALTGPMTPDLLAKIAGESGVAYLATRLEDFPTGFDLIFRDILHRAQEKK
jgi:hypothetical protein